MHQLKQVEHRFGLVLGSAYFHQTADREIPQINLKHRREGFGQVPGKDEGGRHILAAGVPNFEHFRL